MDPITFFAFLIACIVAHGDVPEKVKADQTAQQYQPPYVTPMTPPSDRR